MSILRETEEVIRDMNLKDFSDTVKVRNFCEAMGYAGYVSGKDSDRRKLYVMDVYPARRKADNSIYTKSIGSGIEARFTVFKTTYMKSPINKDDIIYCREYKRNGQYFNLYSYDKII